MMVAPSSNWILSPFFFLLTLVLISSPLSFLFPPFSHRTFPDEDEDDAGEERLPSCFDYVMHFLTVFWKVLFACVPPTDYLNGWACFVVSIVIIGLLTAIIADLASHFGCTIGLKDSVTAVVFVALGTSVPGQDMCTTWTYYPNLICLFAVGSKNNQIWVKKGPTQLLGLLI